jgi:thioredoxin reductase
MTQNDFDVIIVGGSVAGLSAALTLGRALRSVMVIDGCTPCNRTSPYSHNFITQDGSTPSDIIAKAKEQVLQYPTVSFFEDEVVDAKKENETFHVVTAAGKVFRARRLLLCTGLTDLMPDIDGFSDCWGVSILHCPYCHGYEIRDKPTAVMANGEAAFHVAMLIYNWTPHITVLTNGVSQLRQQEFEALQALGVSVVEKEIESVRHKDGNLEKIVFKDGTDFSVGAMYASIPFRQQSPLAENLGCKMTYKGHIEIDEQHRTSIPGVYAAGDNTAEHRAISVAAASGTIAGFTINFDHVIPELKNEVSQ